MADESQDDVLLTLTNGERLHLKKSTKNMDTEIALGISEP